MSPDGFIAGPEDDVGQVFAWYTGGDTEYDMPGTGRSSGGPGRPDHAGCPVQRNGRISPPRIDGPLVYEPCSLQ